MKKIGFETLLGGIFGVIAIIAIFDEMAIAGFNSAAVVGGVKDIAGTIVDVMVFVIAIKNLIPKKIAEEPFEVRLEKALVNWTNKNSNMIIKSKDDDKTQLYGLNMYTDPNGFYNSVAVSKNSGWFLRLPLIKEELYNQENIEFYFHLNKGTFFEGLGLDDETTKAELDKLGLKLQDFISSKFTYIHCGYKNSEKMLVVKFDGPMVSNDDIEKLIDVIDSMYQAYLVSANIKVKR